MYVCVDAFIHEFLAFPAVLGRYFANTMFLSRSTVSSISYKVYKNNTSTHLLKHSVYICGELRYVAPVHAKWSVIGGC